MSDLTVVVPSRGRPEAIRTLARVFADTRTADTRMLVAVDADDPKRHDYYEAVNNVPDVGYLVEQPSGTMVTALNLAALSVDAYAVGFMGDDHRPEGHWDGPVLDALRQLGTGMVYGDDGIQGSRLPTAIFMTTDIVREFGWMAPPAFRHLFVDNAWLDLGRAAECIDYLSHVRIGHRHPVAGLATWDEGYARCNSSEMYQRDGDAYQEWRAAEFPGLVERLRRLRGTSNASGPRSIGRVA